MSKYCKKLVFIKQSLSKSIEDHNTTTGTNTMTNQPTLNNTTTYLAPNVGGHSSEAWPVFDPEDVDSFLEEFEAMADQRALTGRRRCTKLRYCLPNDWVKQVTFFQGYTEKDWDVLKDELVEAFPPNTTTKERNRQRFAELTKRRWKLEDVRVNVRVFQNLVQTAKGITMDDDTKSCLLIDCLPEALATKVEAKVLENDEETPLRDVIDLTLKAVTKAQCWAQAKQTIGTEHGKGHDALKNEKDDQIHQLTDQLQKLTLKVQHLTTEKARMKGPTPSGATVERPYKRSRPQDD
ncbi:hypothetical protein IWQ62_001960 [Dispira parvispora]|uniref:Uncharacterized protein n=1 Tax=Dispira parvispora TaxID=1520584 RepID=A0A9W8E7N1_9FUNG|nr:hypothetical protein IWQ62_001960 [Dispira parvispora]